MLIGVLGGLCGVLTVLVLVLLARGASGRASARRSSSRPTGPIAARSEARPADTGVPVPAPAPVRPVGAGAGAVPQPRATLTPGLSSRPEPADLLGALRLTVSGQPGGGSLVVHYQPVHASFTGQRIGVEALVRWRHPQRGLLTPPSFLPIAEDAGLLDQLGEQVLTVVTLELARWRRTDHHGAPRVLSVNMALSQLGRGATEPLLATLAAAEIAPEHLVIELPESALHAVTAEAAAEIALLHQQGVRFAADDVRSGVALVAVLDRLPISIAKVDRSVVARISSSEEPAEVIGRCRRAGLEVIAQGVETEEQLAELRRLGCAYAQGYLLGTPRPLESWIGSRTSAAPGTRALTAADQAAPR